MVYSNMKENWYQSVKTDRFVVHYNQNFSNVMYTWLMLCIHMYVMLCMLCIHGRLLENCQTREMANFKFRWVSLSQWSVQELLKNCLFCNRYFELKPFAAVKVSGEKGVDEVQDKLLSNYVPPKQCELVPTWKKLFFHWSECSSQYNTQIQSSFLPIK